MITVEIMGGLGNCIFQIFALMAYAMDNKTSFYIEDKPITYGTRKKHYWDTMLSTIGQFRKPCQPNNHIVREQRFDYVKLPTIPDTSKPIKMVGYFQSYKYFEHQYENIMKFINLNNLREPFQILYDYNTTISLHFRVGDYKNLQEHHPLLDESYYVKALKHISKEEPWQVLYFCEDEDIEYVNNKLNIIKKYLPKLTFFKIDSKYDDWEQMLIMSLCKHNIIANSSFSWWAAYFNTNDKIVCYPTTWFGPKQGNKEISTMFPEQWIKIDN